MRACVLHCQSDEAGHIRASQFGGNVDPLNIVPQSQTCNKKSFVGAEQWTRGLRLSCPSPIIYSVEPQYTVKLRPAAFLTTVNLVQPCMVNGHQLNAQVFQFTSLNPDP